MAYAIVDGGVIVRVELTDAQPNPGKASRAKPIVDQRSPPDPRLFAQDGADIFTVTGDVVIRTAAYVPRYGVEQSRALGADIIDGRAADRLAAIRTPGMDQTYAVLKREADALMSGGDIASCPALGALAVARGEEIEVTAATIRERAADEVALITTINAARHAAKLALVELTTVEQIATAVAQGVAAIEAAQPAPHTGADLPRFLQGAAPTWQPTSRDWQIRYELAVQARNGSARAIDLLGPEAAHRAMTVTALADEIIADRGLDEARVAQAFATAAGVTPP